MEVWKNVLKKVQKLEAIVKSQPSRRKTLKDLNMEELYREVMDRPETEIAAAIEQVMLAVAKSIMDGNGFAYQLPSRGQNDQVYIDQLDRIVLKNKSTSAAFTNMSSVRKVTILTRVMQLVHGVLSKGIHVTKRDLFYTGREVIQRPERFRWGFRRYFVFVGMYKKFITRGGVRERRGGWKVEV